MPDEKSHVMDGPELGTQRESCKKTKNQWGVFFDDFGLRSPVIQETVSDNNCYYLYIYRTMVPPHTHTHTFRVRSFGIFFFRAFLKLPHGLAMEWNGKLRLGRAHTNYLAGLPRHPQRTKQPGGKSRISIAHPIHPPPPQSHAVPCFCQGPFLLSSELWCTCNTSGLPPRSWKDRFRTLSVR